MKKFVFTVFIFILICSMCSCSSVLYSDSPIETIIVEKEITVPAETIIVEKVIEVPAETVVVEKPVEVIKEITVPAETIVIEKPVEKIKTVTKEVIVEKTVEVIKKEYVYKSEVKEHGISALKIGDNLYQITITYDGQNSKIYEESIKKLTSIGTVNFSHKSDGAYNVIIGKFTSKPGIIINSITLINTFSPCAHQTLIERDSFSQIFATSGNESIVKYENINKENIQLNLDRYGISFTSYPKEKAIFKGEGYAPEEIVITFSIRT